MRRDAARVSLQLVAGAPDGVFGVEVSGNGPPFRSFRVVRIDPVTLHLTRTGVIAGAPGGLSVDAHTVYVGVTGARAVLRWHSRDLTRLRSWRDPLGVLRGPLAATRSGLWVADRHGLTRLLGDDDAAGDSADRFPPSILMRSAWDAPDLIGNAFWVTALDGQGCPGLYQGSGPNGLEGSPVAVLHRGQQRHRGLGRRSAAVRRRRRLALVSQRHGDAAGHAPPSRRPGPSRDRRRG